ncbi:MAG TPA: flagellar hook-basal body complex protein FliE [Terracidiphilus sp.]|jgi:flagellar hook-basal body complex protein FliE|nr:flagellar hook-basal body complex protein FliE [Terracidiphilus sp.]
MASPIHAIQQVAASTASSIAGPAASSAPSASGGTPFSDLMTNAIGDAGRLEDQANTAVTGLMTGTGVDVHTAMIASEKASMAFEMALAVRNKAVQAYQQVMNLQF